MIWDEDEMQLHFLLTSNRVTARNQVAQNKRQTAFSSVDPWSQFASEMNTGIEGIVTDIKSDIYHKTVGYGLIAVGAGVLVATRGAGWKASGIIMNTGLQNLAEVSE